MNESKRPDQKSAVGDATRGRDVAGPDDGHGDERIESPGATREDSGSKLVKLRILDKEVQLACQSGEEDELLQAAAYVNRSMQELKRRNTTSSIEKIAIVTAINTASSLLQARAQAGDDGGLVMRLSALNRTLDEALTDDAGNVSPGPADGAQD